MDQQEQYIAPRDERFITLIKSLLIKGKLKSKYINLIIKENIHIFSQVFTSESMNSANNYQNYEQIGDVVIGMFLVNYTYSRFPELMIADGVKTVARIKIKYGSREHLSSIADNLGFWKFISASEEELYHKKKDLLEDVFEAFIGAISWILDQVKTGLGYAICYDILSNIFDTIDISLKHEDLYDAKTRLKEIFDVYKNELGQVYYKDEKNDKIVTSTVYYIDKNRKTIILGIGHAARKIDAQQLASDVAIKKLKQIGYQKL